MDSSGQRRSESLMGSRIGTAFMVLAEESLNKGTEM